MKTALLAGATGLIGRQCLDLLVASPHYEQVIVVTRRPLPDLPSKKAMQVVTEFDQLAKVASRLKADDVFCCLGTTIKKARTREAFYQVDHDFVLNLARETQAAGATQFLVISAMGADADSKIFYNRVKGETERDLKHVPFQALHILRPSLLTGNRQEFRLGERLADWIFTPLSPLLRGSMAKFRPIAAFAVAQAMVKIAQSQKTGEHVYLSDEIGRISGFMT